MINTIKERIELLKEIHQYFINEGDEEIYEEWIITGVPDEPSEEDYKFIAENSREYSEVITLAASLGYR